MDSEPDSKHLNRTEINEMKNKLDEYQKKQKKWSEELEKLRKNMVFMEEEIRKQKNINAALLKKAHHKRTCSDEQTFIFSQTNISSYYPILLVNQKQKPQKAGQTQKPTQKPHPDITPTSPNQPSPSHSPSQKSPTKNPNPNSQHIPTTAQILHSNTNLSISNVTHITPSAHCWVPRANLRSHLDSVRTLRWQGQFLISAGEDCLLKIWEKDKLRIAVRDHLAPIFCLCGDEKTVFSGGAEGVVRKWMVDQFLESGEPVAEVELHEDSIWDMLWIPNSSLLITSSSDSSLKLVKSHNRNSLVLTSQINLNPQIPTSICSLLNDQLACGVVKSPQILIHKLQKPHKPSQILTFQHKKTPYFQSNKLLFHNQKNLLISAHEDHTIRLFDPSSNKSVGNIVAHSDSVTSLCMRENSHKEQQIISASHDGTVRVWDIRKWKCIHDIGIHMKKFDQSLLALAYGKDVDLLAVGGADGQIKILSPQC